MRYAVWFLFSLSLTLMIPSVYAGSTSLDLSHDRGAWELAQSHPAELMRQTTQNEIENSYGHRPPLRYQLRKITAKSDLTKEIVETSDGGVAQLTAIDGRPLSSLQKQQEVDRLRALNVNPAIEAHRHRNETQDAERVRKLMRLLPNAFLYRYMGPVETANGAMIRLGFEPNPEFSPPDFESRILTGVRGEVWIDPEEMRAVRMEGRIFKSVDFGWGILGTLHAGGAMLLEQSKTFDCGWQMAHLSLHLDGKELLFKSLHITVEETATDYHPVPADWKYKDAIRWLLQMTPMTPQITKE